MKILVGLGNPGEKYKGTRHNIGFEIVDLIAENYSDSKWIKKFNGTYLTCWLDGKKFLIHKPETFMNNSGQSIQAIVSFYKIKLSDLIIFHDDLDLVVGKIKLKMSGGHAGHNGLRSIHQIFGDKYTRIRIGIDRPVDKQSVSSYVLSNFTESDIYYILRAKKLILSQISALVSSDYKSFINAINKKDTRSVKNSKLAIKEYSSGHSTDSSRNELSEKKQKLGLLKKLFKKTN